MKTCSIPQVSAIPRKTSSKGRFVSARKTPRHGAGVVSFTPFGAVPEALATGIDDGSLFLETSNPVRRTSGEGPATHPASLPAPGPATPHPQGWHRQIVLEGGDTRNPRTDAEDFVWAPTGCSPARRATSGLTIL